MSFWANKNWSAQRGQAQWKHRRTDLDICCWAMKPFCPSSLCARWQTWTRTSWWPREKSSQQRKGEGRGGRGACLRQRVSGLVWFACRGSPLYPGFPAAGWGERLVSSGAAEKCQSTQRADLRSYGNKTNSEWAEAGYRRYTIKTRGQLQEYSPENKFLNPHVWDVEWSSTDRAGFQWIRFESIS